MNRPIIASLALAAMGFALVLGSAAWGDAQPRARPRACAATRVGPLPAGLRQTWSLDPFYVQYADAGGIPVLASAEVEPRALVVAADVVQGMLQRRPGIRAALIERRVRVGVMADTEVTTDMPEHADLNRVFPGTDWNARARGVGATLARPLTTVGEENLLGLPGDRYRGESILVHEFAHTIFELGAEVLPRGRELRRRLDAAYRAARRAGRWERTYAAVNANEYWAEGVQSWFDINLQATPANGIHNDVDTRQELRAYDPVLAQLIEDVLGVGPWRPLCMP